MGVNILDRIVAKKKAEVAEAKKAVPAADLEQRARARIDVRPFGASLAQPGPHGVNIIAEIKRASPSKGVIRADLDPAEYARRYESGGAAAMSVLTDKDFFCGSFNDLRSAREAAHLPVLRKDFIISSYQVVESVAFGADAILLIVRILSENQLGEYLSLSRELQVDALVEVHSEEELDIASEAGARLIGVNNRNLDVFKTDINMSIRLAQRFQPQQTGVAESGIHSREDILKIRAAGIFNFLIGESLVRADDTRGFLKNLLGLEENWPENM
ncbi:MAG: indole-3-glycerol phosphate synthase TrpC [Desulfobacterales bacterium]